MPRRELIKKRKAFVEPAVKKRRLEEKRTEEEIRAEKPAPAEISKPERKQVPDETQVFKNQRGELSGFIDPATGNVVLGAKPQEVREFIEKTKLKREIPQGAISVPEGKAQVQKSQQAIQQQQLGVELAKRVGEITPEQQAEIDAVERSKLRPGQTFAAGVTAGLPAAAVTGGITAATGVGVPLAPFTAGAAFFTAALAAAKADLKKQQSGNIDATAQNLANQITELNKYIKSANGDPANANEYLNMFNEQLAYIQRDYGKIKLDTKGFIASITDKGTPEIAKYTAFYEDGERARLILAMEQALATPDPRKALELSQEELGVL